jgi:thiamine-phosphate pyrophosphorylase
MSQAQQLVDADIGFYGILTKPVLGYERLAEIMVEHGVKIIQLRMKDQPRREVEAVAHRLRGIIPPGHIFIVNDDPEIAREVGADGVHIGQDDMEYSAARRIVGADAIIGLSTHNPVQTRAACALAPDYIGVGPVFATPTKEIPDPVIGLDGMAEMLALATVPAVAIGGIELENAADVVAAGARFLCAVRAINQAADPGAVLERFHAIIAGKV